MKENKIILIDNGHGIDTLGKCSPDKRVMEYLINRIVAQGAVSSLKSLGYDARLLVPEINDISLGERVRRTNKICDEVGAGNAVLISTHCNAAGGAGQWLNAQGWSAYTTKGKTMSDLLANSLYEVAERVFADRKIRRDMSDGDPDWEADFYIIKKTKCPAVLIENFFMDNREDAEFLLSEDGQKRMIEVIVEGVSNYIDQL